MRRSGPGSARWRWSPGGEAVLVATDRVPHNELAMSLVRDEYETMAVVEETKAAYITPRQGEASVGDTIRGHESRHEGSVMKSCVEETEEGRVVAMAEAESAEEAGVGDEAAPALADEGCAREGGGLRREAE